jgi:cellulose synthase (UDP-forming)
LLWAAEAYGFFTFLLFAFMTWRLVYPKTPTPPHGISVDVFLPTRGEPIDILRATLVGCTRIRYPHQTFVLDDSGRAEVQVLATELECGYISRHTHEGAKAGNLNHALKKTKGELVAILDADHVPLPGFLHDTVGFFNDPSVAVVQGPQLFYNLDSFQHERSAWHEQRVFYHVIMPGKNRTNSAFWCGSPAVLRRSALEEIGGIAQETVTEDLHTTIRLAKRGYRVVYTEKPLAVGLAPATIKDYLGQRFRWGQGAMQILRSKDSPLWTPGLTIAQRLSFIASTITYFDGLQLLILLAIPIVTLLTGLLPVSTFGWAFIARLIPYLVLIFLANTLLGRGTYNLWYVERYSLLRAFTFVSTLSTLLTGWARPFLVTGKEVNRTVGLASWRAVIPHLITIVLSLIAIVVGALQLFHGIWYQQQSAALAVAIVWTMINVALLSIGVGKLLGVSHRLRYRFPIVTEVRWRRTRDTHWEAGHSINLSATGISFEHSGPQVSLGDHVEITILITIPASKLPVAQDYTSPALDESKILFTGRVVGEYPTQLNGTQRLGLVIDKFAREADANNYTYLLYHPAPLLRGEQIFQPPVSSAGVSKP